MRDERGSGWRAFLRERVVSLSQFGAMSLALCTFVTLFAPYNAFADVLASFRHLFALSALPTALVLAATKHRVLALVAAATLVGNLAFIVDAFPTGAQCTPNLTVVTLNALGPDNDVVATKAQLARVHADIVIVTEVGRALDAALASMFGHSFSFPDEGTRGMGIYSRFPLRDARRLPGAWFPELIVQTTVNGAELIVLAAHPPPPISGTSADLRNAEVRGIARTLAGISDAVVLGGDLNMTRQSPHFMPLLQAGLRDSRVGNGVRGTWPSPSPFRVGIDHILHTPELTACELETGQASGSDHLPLIARLEI